MAHASVDRRNSPDNNLWAHSLVFETRLSSKVTLSRDCNWCTGTALKLVCLRSRKSKMPSPQMTSPSSGGAAPAPSPPQTTANPPGNYKPSRFGRPCDACKRRKQRCVFRDSQDGVCLMCEFQSVPCTFTDVASSTPTTRKRTVSADTPVRKRRSKSNK